MTTRILLVTGSRALVASTHEERARALLHAAMLALGPTVVVTGDADGPDFWAATWAAERGIDLRVYALDGWVHSAGKLLRPWVKEPGTPGVFQRPLVRNMAMVREAARQIERNSHVEVLALEALWSTTKGTAQTLGKARKAGLPITRITFGRSNGR